MASGLRAFIHDRLISRILTINDTPHAIALGSAVGMFLAMTPTVGLQIVLAIAICTLIGANRIAACVLVFVSNPLTMLPIYWVDYQLGCWITGATPVTHEAFDATWQSILDAGMIGGILEGARVLLGDIGVPMMIGGSILGVIFGVPLYPITYRAVVAQRKRREARIAYERLRELRAEAPVDPLRAPHRSIDATAPPSGGAGMAETEREESIR